MTSHQAFVGIQSGIQVKDNKYPSDMRINKTPTIKKNTVNMIDSIPYINLQVVSLKQSLLKESIPIRFFWLKKNPLYTRCVRSVASPSNASRGSSTEVDHHFRQQEAEETTGRTAATTKLTNLHPVWKERMVEVLLKGEFLTTCELS